MLALLFAPRNERRIFPKNTTEIQPDNPGVRSIPCIADRNSVRVASRARPSLRISRQHIMICNNFLMPIGQFHLVNVIWSISTGQCRQARRQGSRGSVAQLRGARRGARPRPSPRRRPRRRRC